MGQAVLVKPSSESSFFAGYFFKDTLAGNLARLRGGTTSNLAVRRQHLNPLVATQKPKWSQKSGGQFQVGVGVGKPLPSQLFSLEPKKKVVFVTEEGDFQPFFPNYNSINLEVERKEEEAWLREVKMQRKEEEKLLQLQKQKMKQELYMKTVQRKQEESQR